jgi:hypothetical protein
MMLTAAFGTAAPEGSVTVPSIVPAFPKDWERAEFVNVRSNTVTATAPSTLFIILSIGMWARDA